MKKIINGKTYDFFCAILPGESMGWVFKIGNKPGLYQPNCCIETDLEKVILAVKNGKFHGPYENFYGDYD